MCTHPITLTAVRRRLLDQYTAMAPLSLPKPIYAHSLGVACIRWNGIVPTIGKYLAAVRAVHRARSSSTVQVRARPVPRWHASRPPVMGTSPLLRRRLRPQHQAPPASDVEPIRLEIKPDWGQRLVAVGSIASVLLVGIGLIYTNNANRDQYNLTAQGQVTDRFAKAIEHLGQTGSDKVDVRLGAVYALERIMRDSEVDHPAVVEVLATFVRVHSPLSSPPGPSTKPVQMSAGVMMVQPDVQAALTVLGRRDVTRDRADVRLDLSRTNLAGANLLGANLMGADLSSTDLSDVSLAGANLTGAFLFNAKMHNSNAADANLAHASLSGADLSAAYLVNANMAEATFSSANMAAANIFGAYPAGTELPPANLTAADLSEADLVDAHLANAVLIKADLSGADLHGAIMFGTELVGANLSGANLAETHELTSYQVRCAQLDDKTIIPPDVAQRVRDAMSVDPGCTTKSPEN